MLDALRRPLSLPLLIGGSAAAALLIAIYCVAYTALAGRAETFGESLAWAVANICPWLLAIEAGKRADRLGLALLALVCALIGSLALGYALGVSNAALGFEAVRRMPALLLSATSIALLRSRVGAARAESSDIPLLPRQIDWIRAAGNYIELRVGNRTIVHRSSIGAAERRLADHGFVRIHRSTLVRRDRIARVRPQDVILVDGTHLKLGKRYRAALPA